MAGANAYNFLIAVAATVGSFTYGFNNSVIAPVYGERLTRCPSTFCNAG